MKKLGARSMAVALVVGLAATAPAETRKVVAGELFDRGGVWRFWFGDGFRAAWLTPAELPVLDLATEAGGLTPLRQVGALQTVGLAMKGKDGRAFTFRKLIKEPERTLPKDWLHTPAAAIVKDQTAAGHPAAPAIIGALARSVGILFYDSRVMVMPDDPALGEFRATFGGTVGTFDEYLAPGREGITEIISTEDLWKKWREGGPENQVDSRAFLKARLFDLAVGNWDRHYGQWRWAHIAGQPSWVPLPEDADQALTRYEGLALTYARKVVPRLMRYKGEYPGPVEGFTANNGEVTRWLPTDLDWPAFEQLAREVQAQMTDAAIDAAMHQMPAEWYALDGAQLTQDLKARRDGLVEFARRFYRHLADRVDVRGSDRNELATVSRLEQGGLDITIAPLNADGSAGAPSYHRVFLAEDTKEVRLYLLGGNDRLVTSGHNQGRIRLRVMGGGGNDTLDDSHGGGAELRDSEGANTFARGPGTDVDEDPWTNPAPRAGLPWVEPRSYGHWTVPMAQVWWEPNQAFMLGGGVTRTTWGFREYPWQKMQSAGAIFSTGYMSARLTYSGEFRLAESAATLRTEVMASGIEDLNYFGLGNETPDLEKSSYLTKEGTFSVFPSLRLTSAKTFQFLVGAEVKALKTKGEGETLVELEQPYGAGNFGELKLHTGFEYDSRGRSTGLLSQPALPNAAQLEKGEKVTGVRVMANGFYAPRVWEVTDDFGRVDGSLAGYLGNRKAALAVRVGGSKAWGPYPYFESASIGGSDNVRGWDGNRFRGDASLYANAEFRTWLGHRKAPLLPVEWGLIGFYDVGRVWLAGESSDAWHAGYGAGLMAQPMGLAGVILLGTMASSTEGGLHFYVGAGYAF